MIVFIPALYHVYDKYGITLNQFDSVAMPIYRELQRRGVDVKWGTWDDDADVYVCTNPYKFRGKKHKLVYCPDGLGLQESVYQIYGGILFPGPYWRQVFEETHDGFWKLVWEETHDEEYHSPDTEKDPCFPSIGWPPLDLCFGSARKEREEQLREELKLPYEKTVMFGGLYDGRGGFVSEYMKSALYRFLDAWGDHAPVNVIYKGHVLTTVDLHSNEVVERWMPVKARMDKLPYCNFVDPIKGGNIFDYALVSDIIVSGEGASALTSYMAAGVPTVQLGMRWYTDIRSKIGESYIGAKNHVVGFSYSVSKFRPVPQIFMPGFVSDIHTLSDVVHYALGYPNKYREQEEQFLEKMLYEVDGKISERAADALIEIGELWG